VCFREKKKKNRERGELIERDGEKEKKRGKKKIKEKELK
jgi:hypothetical protein